MKGHLIIDTWDNGGETADRFTIAISGLSLDDDEHNTFIIGSSSNPTHPQGFWQHSHELPSKDFIRQDKHHWGKRINFLKLPREVQQCIFRELTMEEP